jgi:hypothetical protein
LTDCVKVIEKGRWLNLHLRQRMETISLRVIKGSSMQYFLIVRIDFKGEKNKNEWFSMDKK